MVFNRYNALMKECNGCGKCCIKYGDGALSASKEEIEMWALFRPEIYQYVQNEQIWFDPKTKQQLSYCPFLEVVPSTVAANEEKKYSCKIYLDRPEDCRFYPSNIAEMVRDECEMIEITDLTNQTTKKQAQVKLDKLMSDSRPPSEY